MTAAGDDPWAGPSLERCRTAYDAAVAAGLVDDDTPAVVFHDLTLLDRRVTSLNECFPPGALHAIAIKANPVVGVLRAAVDAGAGLEAASIEEVHLALAAGCTPDRIVFDSPAKSDADIRAALDLGIRLNADNLDEIDRLDRLGAERSSSIIGVRVNPAVGEGTIGITSVAGAGSRFGLPAPEAIEVLPERFAEHRFLRGLHVHVGSQGTDLDLLTAAAARIDEIRDAIDRRCGTGRVTTVDIGGGLPTRYVDEMPPTPPEYVAALRERAPALLDGSVELVTEFGRAVQANCGWAVSRVEYVKTTTSPTAVIHLGADFLLRPAYRPDEWHHRFSLLSDADDRRAEPPRRYTIAGPLCFSGDVVGRDVELPRLVPGDRLVIHDVGAYTMGMWSRHCSRGMPAVIGVRDAVADAPDGTLTANPLRSAESPADIVRFWGG